MICNCLHSHNYSLQIELSEQIYVLPDLIFSAFHCGRMICLSFRRKMQYFREIAFPERSRGVSGAVFPVYQKGRQTPVAFTGFFCSHSCLTSLCSSVYTPIHVPRLLPRCRVFAIIYCQCQCKDVLIISCCVSFHDELLLALRLIM